MGFAIYNASATITADPTISPGTLAAYLWGEGGNGGSSAHGVRSGAGGGAGAFAGDTNYAGVTPGSTTLTLTIGTGGTGTNTVLAGGTNTWTAAFGGNASGSVQGTGGVAGSAPIAFKGGDGAVGINGATTNGAGGGGSAGSTSAGGNATTSTGGPAGTGGTDRGHSLAGAAGASGAGTSSPGANGTTPGSGASGGGSVGAINNAGGTGAPGQILLVWTDAVTSLAVYAAMPFIMATAKHAVGQFQAYFSFSTGPRPAAPVNQWKASFSQPAAFGNMPPALQSVNIPLDGTTSVGGGSGTPTQGTWLFCVVTVNEPSASAGYTIGVSDDIHGWWRPGDVPTSTWAVSTASGLTRTMAWYVPNTARVVDTVYVAPNGPCDSISVLVVEVDGLGPWDKVVGIATNYAGAATTLNLALSAPSAQAFVLVAAGGDSTTAGQSLAPTGWTALQTVTATNGVDHSCDSVLTAACMVTSSSVSVNATASSATDLSGVAIAVLTDAPSPIPAGQNPNWPYLILEAALGSGYQTPADERTWTSLNDWAVSFAPRRFWSFTDSTGVAYAQGQLQSSTGGFQLDNFDGALSPWNSSGPYFGLLDTGVPIRIRAAIGTIKGVAVNRWYVIERNALKWPEKRSRTLRNYVPLTTTDIWSVMADTAPSPYRAEVLQDLRAAVAAGGTAWWWPADDQPLSGGVLPTSLRNAAPGSSTALQIIASPGGVGSQDAYSTTGVDLTSQVATFGSACPAPGVASYNVGQLSGWGYGDPQSSPATGTAGGPITASPGSAAWQQTGLLGSTGSAGWFLAAQDSYPSLTTGCTIVGWHNYGFVGSAKGVTLSSTSYDVAEQPVCPLTLCELATNSAPLAILQLDTSGHLVLKTYSSGSETSHSVYTGSDLRCASFFMYSIRLTASTWEVQVNAGLTGGASGSATISPTSPTWFVANGDLGSSGGSTLSAIQHGGNVAISHTVILPGLLPAWRELAWYQAMITGFGQLPAPSGLSLSAVANQTQGGGSTPDGSEFQGSYGFVSSTQVTSYTFSAVAVATAGGYTSGPSARATIAGIGQSSVSPHIGAAVWASWSALAPAVQLYTSATAGAETEAGAALGAGDSYTSGYGAGASGHGVSRVSAGTGASPPAEPSALGDQVWQRIERILGNGQIRMPNRSVDATATEPVQAANDTGGQQTGSSLQNMVDSDNGLMSVDLLNTLCYRSRPHLAADTPAWQIGMDPATTGRIPFMRDITWSADPQRVWDSVTVTPYSPDGATLPVITPANATAVAAAISQRGPRPKAVTSYLQDQSKMQVQADWLFANFATLQRRGETVTIDAAKHPRGWEMWFGLNVGDVAQVYDAPFGGMPASLGSYRVSSVSRSLSNGANGTPVEGKMTLTLDPLPASYWS